MKRHHILLLLSLTSLLFISCGDDKSESQEKSIENPVDTYMDSRVHAIDIAKESVGESNKRVEEQNKAMEALTK